MTETTPPASQGLKENDPLDSEPVSPKLPRYQQRPPKQKKPPTVTPRTFTRFFTPKSLSIKASASRRALREISASGANSRSRRDRYLPTPASLVDENGEITRLSKRRKLHPPSPAPSVELSSPIKRIRHQNLDLCHDSASDHDSTDDESDHEVSRLSALRRAKYDPMRRGLHRELCGSSRSQHRTQSSQCPSYAQQVQTSSFYSTPEDVHVCSNLQNGPAIIPFCATPCNNNTLMAIGDEDGGVHILESSGATPSWPNSYLHFRPHHNAILDVSFSHDDSLLVTASGDQTSRVIDMPTQRTVYTLAGHASSVKQAQFQPGTSHLIASSSRDGSVQIWDLRCKGIDGSVQDLRVPLDPATGPPPSSKLTFARSVNAMFDAHMVRSAYTASAASLHAATVGQSRTVTNLDTPSRTELPGRRGDVSVTSLQFLPESRAHLLLTGSEADASVRLWDLRTTYNHRRGRCVPLSVVPPPESHTRHRPFGLNSIALSTDASRMYTLCRDNTIYAYSTSHIILGSAPELQYPNGKPRRSSPNTKERCGLAPLYGFRHPSFHATTFYVKASIRKAQDDRTELLAVGSSDGTPILFPTDESVLRSNCTSTLQNINPNLRTRPGLTRADSFSNTRLEDTIPIYDSGTRLVGAHQHEVTAVSWSHEGKLVSLGDDYRVRLWHEGGEKARELRTAGDADRGRRWGSGWAEVNGDWDEEDG